MMNVLLAVVIKLIICLNIVSSQSINKVPPYDLAENIKSAAQYLSYSFWSSPTLIGSQCRSDMTFVFREATDLNLWAIKMLDASAKLPSGVVSGNLNQFGDFDECLSVRNEYNNHVIKGKYCLTTISIKTLKSNETNKNVLALDDAIHSYRILTNEPLDQGHRIPKLETFIWGLCIPSTCNSEEVEKAFDYYLNHNSEVNSFKFKIYVNDEVCYTSEDKKNYLTANLLVITLYSALFFLIVLDLIVEVDKLPFKSLKVKQILKCFSLKKNWKSLMTLKSSEDDIECIHGARFLNAIALLLSHKQMAMLFSPTFNRTAMGAALSKSWTMIGRSAILYTDSFILFSGMLASYSFIKDLDDKKVLNFKNKLINRIVRFTPNLMGIILFCTFIMEDMNSGPMWSLVVSKYSSLCKKYMWRNLLYVHNYFGFENMCLTHTHQLGIDMQLFLVSPIFIYLLWKLPKLGTIVLLCSSAFSTWLRYEVTKKENLSTLIYNGISVEKLWKTANLSYILPSHRLTVYLLGVLLGYYLRRNGKHLKLNIFQVTFGWVLSITAGLVAMFGFYKAAYKEYVYNPLDSAVYNAFAPILWALFLMWGILACVNGYGGFFNKFLSWKYFKIFTKISYAIYLTQFPVFFYGVGTERVTQYYKGFQSLFDVSELFIIILTSLILTLLFDIPFQELKKTAFTFKENKVKKDEEQLLDTEKTLKNKKVFTAKKKLQMQGT